jgi:nucleoside phosphorylase
MGVPIDVVIIIPRDHEVQNFLEAWPYSPSGLDSKVFAIRLSTPGWNRKLNVRIESLHDGQGLLDAYTGCVRVIENYKPRLIILAGTAGVFPGCDATLGDVVWSDGQSCLSIETLKLNADSTVNFAPSTSCGIEKNFKLDFSEFQREWQRSLSVRTNPSIKFSVVETSKADELFRQRVQKSQKLYTQRSGVPEIVRASSVYSTNARISDPVVAQYVIAQAAPTICEMELAGCIRACNKLGVSLVSIRSCSDVVGTEKSDKDSTQASLVVADACAKFLSLQNVQQAIKETALAHISSRQRSQELNSLIDVVERLDEIDKTQLAIVANKTLQEIKSGRVTIFQAADVLVVALRDVCCSCGSNINNTFEPFREVIAYIVNGLNPGENQEFFLKALEIFVSMGDTVNSVTLQKKLLGSVSTRNTLSLIDTRRAVHALGSSAKAIELMTRMGNTLKSADRVDASQAAMHFSCMLCQQFGLVDRAEFEEAFYQFYAVLSKIDNKSTEKDMLLGKATVLRILNEWVKQDEGWLKRTEELVKLVPNTSWLTPAARVLYLTFLKSCRTLTAEEATVLELRIAHLRATPLLYTCNLDVRGVLTVAAAAQPLALNSIQMSRVLRPDRRHSRSLSCAL